MAYTMMVDLHVTDPKEYLAWASKGVALTRSHEGCMSFLFQQDLDDASRFRTVQLWVSREHARQYAAERKEDGNAEKMYALSVEPPVVRWFNLLDM